MQLTRLIGLWLENIHEKIDSGIACTCVTLTTLLYDTVLFDYPMKFKLLPASVCEQIMTVCILRSAYSETGNDKTMTISQKATKLTGIYHYRMTNDKQFLRNPAMKMENVFVIVAVSIRFVLLIIFFGIAYYELKADWDSISEIILGIYLYFTYLLLSIVFGKLINPLRYFSTKRFIWKKRGVHRNEIYEHS